MLSRGASRTPRRACCDFRKLPFRDGTFDAMLCLYDAVNYCSTLGDLDAFFSEAHRVLEPGGVIVFDATTSRNSRQHFSDVVFHDRVGGSDVIRHSWYDDVERIQHNDFTIFAPRKGGGYDRLQESHAQRVWTRSVFRSCAARAGLEMLGCWDDDLAVADSSTLRLHMACRKPAVATPVS
jgi:SAM-dependent methyltransferase